MYKYHRLLTLLFCLFILLLVLFPFADKIFAFEIDKYPIIAGEVDLNATPGVQLPAYMKYLFAFGMFMGFLSVFISITLSGVLYIISYVYPGTSLLVRAKDFFSGAMAALLILVSLYVVIITINPYLAIFDSDEPAKNPPLPQLIASGIKFYNSTGCTGDDFSLKDTSTSGFGNLKNRINSAAVVHDPAASRFYVGVLYENSRYSGKCLYINPNLSCQPIASFGSSVSIHQYNPSPNDDGVYFYRKSYFNKDAGYFKIKNDQIKNVYSENLDNLTFTDPALIAANNPDGCTVPENDRDKKRGCAKYNTDGTCKIGKCQSLAGTNISSMQIKGNYIVLLVYKASQDPAIGPWTSCQEFPADPFGAGPTQIKWEDIRKNNYGLPNSIIIIPIKK